MPSGRLSCEAVEELVQINSAVPDSDRQLLLVDCRPFFIYNESHISDAVNVFCSKFLLRRKGNLLEKIFVDVNVLDRIRTDLYSYIVVYEERDISAGESVGSLVANALEEETGLSCVYFLEGGFSEFSKLYPQQCRSLNTTIKAISERVSELSLKRLDTGIHVSQDLDPPMIENTIENCSDSSYSFPTFTWPFKSKNSQSPHKPVVSEVLHSKKSCLQLNLTKTTVNISHSHNGNGNAEPFRRNADKCLDSVDDEELPEPSELTPYLFIGSQSHSSSFDTLLRLGITAILNVSSCCPNYFESDFLYKRIFLRDTGDGDIQGVMNESIDFINHVRENDGKVLVHCRAGMSRSATMCIAYLIKNNNWSMDRAYEFVKSRRPQIAPNFSFMVQMMEFEKKLLCQSPIDDLSSSTSSSALSSSSSASSSAASTPSSSSSIS